MNSFARIERRLTLLYTLVLTGLTVLTVSVLFFIIWLSIEATSTQTLRITARQLANAYELYEDDANSSSLDSVIEALSENETSYIIWNRDFEIVLASENLPIDENVARYLVRKYFISQSGTPEINDFDRGTDSYKILTSGYVSSDGRLLTIQLIKNMSAQRQLLEGPLFAIVMVILISIGLSIVLGNFLAARALEPIRKSYEQQRNFLADASHELRTPVAVVLTNLEALMSQKEKLAESELRWIDNAYSEIKRTRDVVEDLLLLAKADAGEQISEFEPVDVSYLVLEVTEPLESLAQKRGISMRVDISDIDLYTYGDKKRLEELFTILIENAIKYTNFGGQVEVKVYATEEIIRVEVIDNGIGIAEEEQDKIFERFYRVDKARSRREGGTGLGLSIARLIVEEHNGKIGLRSKENEGTTFYLLLDRIPTPDSDEI